MLFGWKSWNPLKNLKRRISKHRIIVYCSWPRPGLSTALLEQSCRICLMRNFKGLKGSSGLMLPLTASFFVVRTNRSRRDAEHFPIQTATDSLCQDKPNSQKDCNESCNFQHQDDVKLCVVVSATTHSSGVSALHASGVQQSPCATLCVLSQLDGNWCEFL